MTDPRNPILAAAGSSGLSRQSGNSLDLAFRHDVGLAHHGRLDAALTDELAQSGCGEAETVARLGQGEQLHLLVSVGDEGPAGIQVLGKSQPEIRANRALVRVLDIEGAQRGELEVVTADLPLVNQVAHAVQSVIKELLDGIRLLAGFRLRNGLVAPVVSVSSVYQHHGQNPTPTVRVCQA